MVISMVMKAPATPETRTITAAERKAECLSSWTRLTRVA